MLSEIDHLQTEVAEAIPAIQHVVQRFESTMIAATNIIAEQEEKINILDRRDYIAQLLLIGGSTLAYLLGLWSGGSVCPK